MLQSLTESHPSPAVLCLQGVWLPRVVQPLLEAQGEGSGGSLELEVEGLLLTALASGGGAIDPATATTLAQVLVRARQAAHLDRQVSRSCR
jgi:hypothetical protein